MPAEQGSGGGKLLGIVGGAVIVGVIVGALCVIAKGSGGHDDASKAVHKEHSNLLHSAESRSRLVVQTTQPPKPAEQQHKNLRAEHKELQESDNKTDNETRNETHNSTKEEQSDHDHKHCSGGPYAACECMLKCEVFGGNISKCNGHSHNETRELVDNLILKTMLSHENMCQGMRCIKECAKQLDCLDAKVVNDCEIVQKNYAENKFDSDPDCDLQCSS